jgi:hypothetical protein
VVAISTREVGDPGIDYRELLKKYMDHVLCEEGTTFVAANRLIYPGLERFSENEFKEILALDQEVRSARP